MAWLGKPVRARQRGLRVDAWQWLAPATVHRSAGAIDRGRISRGSPPSFRPNRPMICKSRIRPSVTRIEFGPKFFGVGFLRISADEFASEQ
jgi:hypothetical protein